MSNNLHTQLIPHLVYYLIQQKVGLLYRNLQIIDATIVNNINNNIFIIKSYTNGFIVVPHYKLIP